MADVEEALEGQAQEYVEEGKMDKDARWISAKGADRPQRRLLLKAQKEKVSAAREKALEIAEQVAESTEEAA